MLAAGADGDAGVAAGIGEGVLREIRGVAIDAKHKSVIIVDKELNAVMTWYVPEVFAQMARSGEQV